MHTPVAIVLYMERVHQYQYIHVAQCSDLSTTQHHRIEATGSRSADADGSSGDRLTALFVDASFEKANSVLILVHVEWLNSIG